MPKKHQMLFVCLVAAAVLLFGIGSAVQAETPDGETPAEETVCDALFGAAFGLCNAYCEAMDCELLDDGDPNTWPAASEQACLQVKENFLRITGEAALPCDCPPEAGQVGCPCIADFDCLDDLVCENDLCIEGGGPQ